MPRVQVRKKGGGRLKAAIRSVAKADESIRLEVGFFETARYPPVRTGKNGGQPQTPHFVATVAAWNEFGTRGGGLGGPTPERPFFRQAINRSPPIVRQIVRAHRHPERAGVTVRTVGLVGEAVKNEIQLSIRTLRHPENSDWTIERKGSDNPLIDTATMINSVSYGIAE